VLATGYFSSRVFVMFVNASQTSNVLYFTVVCISHYALLSLSPLAYNCLMFFIFSTWILWYIISLHVFVSYWNSPQDPCNFGAQLPERLMVWQGCGLSVWHLARKVRLAGFANLRAQPGTLKDEWRRALGTGHLSPEDSMKGTRREGSFTGDPERYVK